jgi:hypothetical protein
MRRSPKIAAVAVGFVTAFATLVAGFMLASAVGDATHSGPLGICGPYGPHADLVGGLFLGSFPASLVVGFCSVWVFRRFVRTPKAGKKGAELSQEAEKTEDDK